LDGPLPKLWSRPLTKMATTVQLHCYWKQLWSRWAITGSWEPLVNVVTTCDVFICPEIILWFFTSVKYLKIMWKLYWNLLSFPLLLLEWEITHMKMYNFRIKPGMCKRSVVLCINISFIYFSLLYICCLLSDIMLFVIN
jgi:hypothetical protein